MRGSFSFKKPQPGYWLPVGPTFFYSLKSFYLPQPRIPLYISLFRQKGSTNDKTIKSHTTTVKKVKSTHTQARTKYEPTVTVRHTQAQLRNTETLKIFMI